MKKILSLVLAVMMLLGCMSVTAFAADTNTWSFDSETMTFTVNCSIPKTATIGGEIPQQVNFEGSFDGITGFGAVWGKTVEQDEGFQYGSKWWNSAASTPKTTRYFEAGKQYGYVIALTYDPQTVQKDLANAKIVWNGKEYSNIGVSVPYDVANNMAEVFIVVDFGVLGADGNFTGGDFAETESGNKSGTATITATKAAPLSYKLVIPQNVPTITKAGVTEIGAPSVEDVTGATEKTVISYTASGTQLTLENSDKTMKTSYYTDSEGKTALTDDAIEVYKNSAVIASPTSLYVGVTQEAWDAAEAGTYKATVTFNFSAEEVEKVTIADILPEGFPTSAILSAWQNNAPCYLFVSGDNLCAKGDAETSVPVATVLTPTSGDYNYTCTVSDITWNFSVGENEFWRVNISGFTGGDEKLNGTYGIPR